LGIAATQAAGMQQNRGTMCKSFHAGKAAANGVIAALLAEQGFDSSDEIIEGKRGFCRIYSNVAAPEKVLEDLGTRFEIARNGHKPYACGVVLHPAIDAVIAMRELAKADPSQIEALRVTVHPMAVRITGVAEPQTGLQSKFSIYHSAAVAYVDGNAGIPQYSNEKALDATVVALRRKVGIVFQQYNLFQNMNVLENVCVAPVKIKKRPRREVEEEARVLLAKVGLGDKLKRYPDELSGGQQQRVAIVRALALHPEILLLDEVTAALDPELVSEVLDTIRLLAKEGMTMLIVSHEMAFIREVASRVVFMAGGKVVETGAPAQIFDQPVEARTRDFVSKILRH
jgi:polar amino acid transport system ATP-binding protein